MRPELLQPRNHLGDPADSVSPATLRNVLLLAGHDVTETAIVPWTQLERLLAYDYAMREHLHASDNPIRRRPCPSFVRQASS